MFLSSQTLLSGTSNPAFHNDRKDKTHRWREISGNLLSPYPISRHYDVGESDEGFFRFLGITNTGANMAATTASRATKTKTQVLLVDDHPIVRKGIAELINAEPDLEVCGEASTMQEAMSLAGKLKPGLMIVDISLEGNNGVELMKNLSGRPGAAPILAYSMHDESI